MGYQVCLSMHVPMIFTSYVNSTAAASSVTDIVYDRTTIPLRLMHELHA